MEPTDKYEIFRQFTSKYLNYNILAKRKST